MADVTLKRFDELENDHNQFLYAGRSIGVTSWGMNIIKMPPNWQDYPEHDHVDDGQ